MSDKNKQIAPIPDEFDSYEEAAEFWDEHDTADYLEFLQPVEAEVEFRGRHYEVELDEDVIIILRKEASKRGMTTKHLASQLLRQQLLSAS
jgi:hypothetical protein